MQSSLLQMSAFESTAKATAARKVRAIAVGTGLFLVAQFAGIFQLVYTVRASGVAHPPIHHLPTVTCAADSACGSRDACLRGFLLLKLGSHSIRFVSHKLGPLLLCSRRLQHSWDIMEPVCYFIGTTYGILFYLYFMVRRPPPSCVVGQGVGVTFVCLV